MHFVIFGNRALEGGINMRCLISILFFLICHICFSQVIASDDVVLCDGQQGDVAVTLTATSFAVDLTDSISFNANLFSQVLSANKECSKAELQISSNGLAFIEFNVDDFNVKYWLVSQQAS